MVVSGWYDKDQLLIRLKMREQKHLYVHILQWLYNALDFRLNLGFQNDIEMSIIFVIEVNSIFTGLS